MERGTLLAGRFEVVRTKAKGGMADIIEAVDIADGQHVAAKVLRKGLDADLEAVARFHREARIASTLTSRHVVRIVDFGESDDGRPFLVMELLMGHDLAKEIARRGSFPLKDAVSILVQACEAMVEAHDAGIVHRDLKPTNLFLAEMAAATQVLKVLDFGIAGIVSTPDDERLTLTRSLFGSPLYMSPETFRSAKAADARSDIWSLGVIFYEMITGKVPFYAENPLRIGLAVTREPHVPASTHVPGLPAHVDTVIARALKKDPAERYPSMRAFLEDLGPLLPGGRIDTITIPASVRPPAPSEDDSLGDATVRMNKAQIPVPLGPAPEAPELHASFPDGEDTTEDRAPEIANPETDIMAPISASADAAADPADPAETATLSRPLAPPAPERQLPAFDEMESTAEHVGSISTPPRRRTSRAVWLAPLALITLGAIGWYVLRTPPQSRANAARSTTTSSATATATAIATESLPVAAAEAPVATSTPPPQESVAAASATESGEIVETASASTEAPSASTAPLAATSPRPGPTARPRKPPKKPKFKPYNPPEL